MDKNTIINNRFFNSSLKSFFNDNQFNSQQIYCDIDSLSQFPKYQNCSVINQIKNHNIFGDKYTHYNLLIQNNHKSKYLLETYLFDQINIQKIKNIINKYPIWIIKPRNDYGRNGVTIVRNYNDIYNWINKFQKMEINNIKDSTPQWILQKYVDNPLLINKHKFHIRVYVILHKKKNYINFFLYQKGFIYTAGNKYNWNSNDLKTHLSGEDNPNRVTVFQTSHPLYHKIWNQIKDLVLKCIVPIYPYIQCPNINNQCYKFLGLDILIDDQYNLYLAEINSRLISLKYPPKNFKNDMYLDILNQVYFNKSKMIELIYTNQPTSYTLQSIYEGFSYNSNKIKNLIIVIIFIIIITIIFIKIKYK